MQRQVCLQDPIQNGMYVLDLGGLTSVQSTLVSTGHACGTNGGGVLREVLPSDPGEASRAKSQGSHTTLPSVPDARGCGSQAHPLLWQSLM